MLEDRDRVPLEQDVEDMRILLDEFLVYAKTLGEDRSRNEPVNAITFLDDCARLRADGAGGSVAVVMPMKPWS